MDMIMVQIRFGGANQKSSGMFAAKTPQTGADIGDLKNTLADNTGRLRVLEGRVKNMHKNGQVMEQNMLQENKRVKDSLKDIDADVQDLKKDMHEINETLKLVVREIKDSARKEDVKVLERYLDMWQPLKFMSRKETEDLIRHMLRKRTKSL